MKVSETEVIAAAFSQFGIVAEDREIGAFARWLLEQSEPADVVTYGGGTIQQRAEQLIRDAQAEGLVLTARMDGNVQVFKFVPFRHGLNR